AVLIGLLKAPTRFSPVRNAERSLKRRNVVLSQMKKYDFIAPEEYDSLKMLPIELNYRAQDHIEGLAPYFREYLRGVLAKWCKAQKKPDGTPYDLYKDGLKIYTTINSKMQLYAEDAIVEHLGGELQTEFFKHWKGKKNAPFDWHLTRKEINGILNQAMKRSDRYRMLKQAGVSKDSILTIFNTPTPMRVFSWKGDIDTVMTPMDSILYYKYFLQAGFMAMDPHTGQVKAWAGGINYKHFKYDHVKSGKRQVGSTFKPFVYALAIQEKWPPCMLIPNIPVIFVDEKGEKWSPENADDEFDDLLLPLKFGLANSINYITAYVMKRFSPEAVINISRKMGITSHLDPYPALCLGVSDLSVYEMVGAYSTFANKGIWTEPILVTRIEDNKGNVIQEFIPKTDEAMNEETACLMLNMLKGVVDGVYSSAAKKKIGTAVRLKFKYKFTNSIAGKTGTTQNQSDGWFMGIVPNLVSGVWVGCEDRSVHFRGIRLGQGANMALPIWAIFMKKVYADKGLGILESDDFELLSSKRLHVELDCEKYQAIHSSNFDDKSGGF
ncbi:penicillin-binding protein, partial [bacterium AH-315-M05]|nr:penicillin-binding protein [bacterium AH-315-M05]